MKEPANTTLLIADDDPSHLMLAEAALAGAGFLVHTAGDGEEAVRRYAEIRPDCVILDVMMPKLTGIQACAQIRQLAGQRIVPILMLTGRNDLQAISDAYAAGANDFAQKGMNPRLIVERVRFLLRDRELREELRSSRAKLLLAQSIARVGHWELAIDGSTLHVSPMLGELLGLDGRSIGRYEEFVALLDPAEQDAVRQAFVGCSSGHGGFSFDHRVQSGGDSVVYLHQEAELVQGPGGAEDPVVIVTLQDLTRLHRAEELVQRLSYFDTATGLPNRRSLAEQVSQGIAEPGAALASAVVAFRLHNFDRVVRAQGRDPANRLLAQIARRIETELERISADGKILWRTDRPTVCRSADGELAILLRSRLSSEHLATVTHALLESVSAQALQADIEYVPALSAGVALMDADVSDAEQLIANAHSAAELATDPRSCVLFSPTPQAQLRRRLSIESALRGAVERRELQLLYQPRVEIESFELTGVECFARWDSPQFGKIRPQEFIGIAEEAGIVDDIGRWMLDEVCRQMVAWHERYDRKFFASLRVAGRQLRDPRLADMVRATAERHHLAAAALQIELSEQSIIQSPEVAHAFLDSVRGAGARIGIADVGTGHASIGQIRRLPFDALKLDAALMADLYTDAWTQGVTAAVLSMARATRIRSVADGIDDVATLDMLRALGFDEVQGQYVSPPMKARDFEEWLERGGASHLSRHYTLEIEREIDELDDSVDDIMKWANG
jgi:predicted signal transduction protein with EAL and GGDEF domain/DNA-binding response OmpR family regulator